MGLWYDFDWDRDATGFYDRWATVFAVLAVLYLPVVFGVQRWMKNREPFNLKPLLLVWNILIATFSIVAFLSMIRCGIEHSLEIGFLNAVCDLSCKSRYPSESVRWVFYFNLSKLFEWLDTFFVVLRKRPLIFLHYYHHIYTFLFCWYANQVNHLLHCAGYWFAAMNLLIHSIMYTYYALTSLGFRPQWNKYLTAAQVLQMVFGIGLIIQTTQCEHLTFENVHHRNLTIVGLFMYLSYFVLFTKFFIDRYSKKDAHDTKKPTVAAATKKTD